VAEYRGELSMFHPSLRRSAVAGQEEEHDLLVLRICAGGWPAVATEA
jgi:hypothetical protein